MQDISIVDSSGEKVIHEERNVNTSPSALGGPDGELERVAIGQVLNIGSDEISEGREKIDSIVRWAKTQSEDHSFQNLKWIVKQLEMKLGTPDFGESRLTKVSRFAFLDMEGKRIEMEKEQLYGI